MARQRVEVAVEWTQSAADALREIGSRTIQQKIVQKIEDLAASGEPERLGKPLVDELQGLHRLSFGRYRIVYRVVGDSRDPRMIRIIIRVILVGIRKQGDKHDIYVRLHRMLRRGEL
jgi:mRNA-degrading endonuclease RelE of RelBE toxin-antitoxin system